MQTCELSPLTEPPPLTDLSPLTELPPATLSPATGPGTGRSRLIARRGRLVALAVGAFLLPWCTVLGATLPVTTRAPNWSLAWMGLDLAEAVAALATAALLRRGSPRAGLPAVAGAALLFADAWFDVCTSPPGLERAQAVGEALLVEPPLAAAAIWLAVTLTRDAGSYEAEMGPEHACCRDGR